MDLEGSYSGDGLGCRLMSKDARNPIDSTPADFWRELAIRSEQGQLGLDLGDVTGTGEPPAWHGFSASQRAAALAALTRLLVKIGLSREDGSV